MQALQSQLMSQAVVKMKSTADSDCLEPSPAKKRLTVCEKHRSKYRPVTSSKFNKKWEQSFTWLTFDENFQGAFCKVCRKRGISFQRTGGTWISKPFKNWKAIEKMKTHAKNDIHISRVKQRWLQLQHYKRDRSFSNPQQIGEQEKLKNRMAIKALTRCTNFLARRHIPHTTNFDELVDFIVSCGAEDLKRFLERARKNATYTHVQNSCC